MKCDYCYNEMKEDREIDLCEKCERMFSSSVKAYKIHGHTPVGVKNPKEEAI